MGEVTLKYANTRWENRALGAQIIDDVRKLESKIVELKLHQTAKCSTCGKWIAIDACLCPYCEIDRLNGVLNSVVDDKTNLSEEVLNLREKEVLNLREKLEARKSAITGMSMEIKELQTQNAWLQKRNDNQAGMIRDLRRDKEQEQRDLALARGWISRSETRQPLTKKCDQCGSWIADCHFDCPVCVLRREREKERNKRRKKEEELKAMRGEHANLIARIRRLEAEKVQLHSTLTGLGYQLQPGVCTYLKEDEIAVRIAQSAGVLRDEINSVKNTCQGLEARINAADDCANDIESRLDELNSVFQAFNSDFETLSGQVQDHGNRFDRLNVALVAERRHLEATRGELRDRETMIRHDFASAKLHDKEALDARISNTNLNLTQLWDRLEEVRRTLRAHIEMVRKET